MTIEIDNRTKEPLLPEWEDAIQRAAEKSLAYEGFAPECEISVSIVDNAEIREINRQFRNIDRATDVLSFPMLTFAEGEIAERNENGEILLGDIIISLERAREQAAEYGHSLLRELAFLTAHSMLHLLGYDHMEPEEEAEMFRRQREILLQAGFPREGREELAMTDEKLVALAKEAMRNAYAPYSKFRVGAALLAKDGRIFSGCNIENASYGATICAERTAIFKAVSEGVRAFEKIAIVASSGDYAAPCGICRQVLFEFMPDGKVILDSDEKGLQTFSVRELLPMGFGAEDIK